MLYLALTLLAMAIFGIHREMTCSPSPWLVAVALVSAMLTVIAFVDMAPWPALEQRLHVGTLVNPRRVATMAFLGASALGGLALLHPRLRPAVFPCVTFLVFVIAATGSRGALLAWILFVVLVILLRRRRESGAFVIDSVGALVAASAMVLALHHSGVWESQNVFVRLAESTAAGGEGFTTGRIDLWRTTIGLIFDSPWFGSGPDAFRVLASDASVIYPHNVVLQLLLEFGMVGCVLVAVVIERCLTAAAENPPIWQRVRSSTGAQVLTAMLVSQMMLGMIDGPLYWMLSLVCFAALTGLWFAVASTTPICNGEE